MLFVTNYSQQPPATNQQIHIFPSDRWIPEEHSLISRHMFNNKFHNNYQQHAATNQGVPIFPSEPVVAGGPQLVCRPV